jgi:hypothetical protein
MCYSARQKELCRCDCIQDLWMGKVILMGPTQHVHKGLNKCKRETGEPESERQRASGASAG